MSSIIIALGGTQATGLVKFLIDSFGGSEDYKAAKEQILTEAPTAQDLEDDVEAEAEDVEDDGTSTSVQTKNNTCELQDAKPFHPVSSKLLSATGVPESFISDNMPQSRSKQSTYLCLYGGCSFSGLQKDTTCTHIRRKHLGHCIKCPLCPEGKTRWWSSQSYNTHITKTHPSASEKQKWTPAPSID